MSQDIRRRTRTAQAPIAPCPRSAPTEEDNDYADMMIRSTGISAQSLINASPTHFGHVAKLHVPSIYLFLPVFVRRCLNVLAKRFPSLSPKWTERFLILLGDYLYRFEDDRSKMPKGSPIEIKAIDANIVEVDNCGEEGLIELMFRCMPSEYAAVFAVSTFTKTQYFAVPLRDDAVAWVNAIREARQESITRAMGHSKVPTPTAWPYFDKLGAKFATTKESIKRRLEEHDEKEMEMSSRLDGVGMHHYGVYG